MSYPHAIDLRRREYSNTGAPTGIKSYSKHHLNSPLYSDSPCDAYAAAGLNPYVRDCKTVPGPRRCGDLAGWALAPLRLCFIRAFRRGRKSHKKTKVITKAIPPKPYDTSVMEDLQRVGRPPHRNQKHIAVDACTMTTIDVPSQRFHSAYTPSNKSASVESSENRKGKRQVRKTNRYRHTSCECNT